MKKFSFKIRGNKYDVELKSMDDNTAEIEVNGTTYTVEVEQTKKQRSKTPTLVRKQQKPSRGEGKIKKNIAADNTVKAPLPGTILKVVAKEGDEIKKGQNIMIMEAMKMENNIMSPKDGTIKSIKVSEGDNVLQDDVLVEIE